MTCHESVPEPGWISDHDSLANRIRATAAVGKRNARVVQVGRTHIGCRQAHARNHLLRAARQLDRLDAVEPLPERRRNRLRREAERLAARR